MKGRLSKYVFILQVVKWDLFCKGIQLLATVSGLGANSTYICYTVTPLKTAGLFSQLTGTYHHINSCRLPSGDQSHDHGPPRHRSDPQENLSQR